MSKNAQDMSSASWRCKVQPPATRLWYKRALDGIPQRVGTRQQRALSLPLRPDYRLLVRLVVAAEEQRRRTDHDGGTQTRTTSAE